MKALTIRKVPEDLADALEREKTRRGVSLNRTVLDLLRTALGTARGRRRNGLSSLAGTWSDEDHSRFEKAVAPFEQVDDELWR